MGGNMSYTFWVELYFLIAVIWSINSYFGQKREYPDSTLKQYILTMTLNFLFWPVAIWILYHPFGKVQTFTCDILQKLHITDKS